MQPIILQAITILLILVDTDFDTEMPFFLCNSVNLLFGINLKQLAEKENMHPFRAARLADRNGDMKKRWYVNYYVWDAQRNELVRKQYYEINNYKTATERYAAARIAVKQINEMLEKGFHIDEAKLDEQKQLKNLTMIKAIDLALEIKKPSIRKSSYEAYEAVVKVAKIYIQKNSVNIEANNWKKSHSIRFLDYLRKDKVLAGVTINRYCGFLKALFTLLVDREMVESNPWKRIKTQKVVKTKANQAFTLEQAKIVLDALRIKNPKLLSFVQTMFYTFMRPAEIRLTKIESVNLNDLKIFVPAEISKNGLSAYIDIPKQLTPIIRLQVENKAPNELLFIGKEGKPMCKNKMRLEHKEILKNLNMPQHTLYSWKHTGVVQAYKAGVDLKSLQLQCRHASIAQTDTYLKSLGIMENKSIKYGMPDLPK